MPATYEDLAVGDSRPKLLKANPLLFRAATKDEAIGESGCVSRSRIWNWDEMRLHYYADIDSLYVELKRSAGTDNARSVQRTQH